MPNYSDLDPAKLKPGLTDGNGNLKPSLTTPLYTGGKPTNANQVKRSIVDAAGNLRAGLVHDGKIKRSLLRDALAAGWNPTQLSNLLQNIASPLTYSGAFGGVPVIPSTVGTNAQPRGKCCAQFDGSDDYATLGSRLTTNNNAMTVAFWVYKVSNPADLGVIVGEYNGSSVTTKNFYIGLDTAGRINAVWYDVAVSYRLEVVNAALPAGFTHVVCTWDGSDWIIYQNGVAQTTSIVSSLGNVPTNVSATFRLGAALEGAMSYFGNLKLTDVRVYSVIKNATEVAAIYNQANGNGAALDRVGLLAAWPMQEESGTTHYDVSGNGRHLTIMNSTPSSYHTTDSGVTFSYPNEFGYTLSGSTIIPRNEANTAKDAAGGNLQNAGPINLPAVVECPAITGDGSSIYVDLGSRLISSNGDFSLSFYWYPATSSENYRIFEQTQNWGILQTADGTSLKLYDGSTISALIPVVANQWNLVTLTRTSLLLTLQTTTSVSLPGGGLTPQGANTALFSAGGFKGSGRVAYLRLTAGGVTRTFPLQDGPGANNTNRDVCWYASDGASGKIANAIVGGTVANIWANRTNVIADECIINGGGIAANGAFVVGVPGSANDAAGNAKTLDVGTLGPTSRFNANYWSAPSLAKSNAPTAYPTLPCMSCDGSSIYAAIPTFTLVGDFEFNGYIYLTNTFGAIWGNSTNGLYVDTLSNIRVYVGGVLNQFTLAAPLSNNTWYKVRVVRVGAAMSLYVNGVAVPQTVNNNLAGNIPVSQIGNGLGGFKLPGRLSDLVFTNAGVVTYFPLSDGSGADVAMFVDGVCSILTNAIQGSPASVWANKTSGIVPYSAKNAVRAIVPRDTKFTNGTSKFFATRSQLTGSDLTEATGFVG